VIDPADKLLQAVLAKTPQCVANFITSQITITLPNRLLAGSQCMTRSIKCICGNDNLNLEAARRKDLRGTCRQEEITTPIPPVYVSCPGCQRYTLLFDPSIHGWHAQINVDDEADDALRLIKCTPHPIKVCVVHAYRNRDGYATLAKSGVHNLEDYFDACAVFVSSSAGENFKELVFCDCS
jgi:hypothetical protein